MKKLLALFVVFLTVSGVRAGEPSDIHTLLRRLDGLLDRREEFLLRHETRLDSLKLLLRNDALGFRERYAVTAEIAERYFAYQSDSTIGYLRRSIALAEKAGDADLTIRAKSVMAMCYSMNGRFLEADLRSMRVPLRQDGVPCNRQVWQSCRLKRSSLMW